MTGKLTSLLLILFCSAGFLFARGAQEPGSTAPVELEVKIFHCNDWNYREEAARVAEEIEKAYGVETEYLEGFEGSFEVIVNGETIFSKLEAGRFPEKGEIIKLLKKLLKNDAQAGDLS